MPEMHLKQPGFTYSACGPFTKNKERIEKFMQTGNTDFIYKNELDKACFQHDMAYGKSKDLAKRTQSDKIASDPKYAGYQRGLASSFLIKNPLRLINLVEVVSLINQIINWQNELHKTIIRKFKKVKVYSSFRDNIWGIDLAHMQSLSKFNNRD